MVYYSSLVLFSAQRNTWSNLVWSVVLYKLKDEICGFAFGLVAGSFVLVQLSVPLWPCGVCTVLRFPSLWRACPILTFVWVLWRLHASHSCWKLDVLLSFGFFQLLVWIHLCVGPILQSSTQESGALRLNRLPFWYLWYSSSQVSSIDTALALGARGCEFESRQCQCFHENWVCLKFPWTRNSLLLSRRNSYETRGADPGCDGWSSPWLMVLHGMVCLGPQWSANICKVWWGCMELQSRGQSALKITCVFFLFIFVHDPRFLRTKPRVLLADAVMRFMCVSHLSQIKIALDTYPR